MTDIKTPLLKKTARLIIRPLMDFDYENWSQAYSSMRPAQNEWDETNWISSELTKAKFKALLKNENLLSKKDSYYHFGIFRKDDGVLIGSVSLMDISRGSFQNAYIGYRIFNPFWGHGYAQEACQAALSIAFKDLKLHRVEAGISPTNKRSIRTAKALGFRKEGLSKNRLLVNKKWADVLIYALTKEDLKHLTKKTKS